MSTRAKSMVKNLSATGARRVLVGTAFPPIADPESGSARVLTDNCWM
jgi:hypothetical protein